MHFVPMKEHFATKLSANRHANSVAEANESPLQGRFRPEIAILALPKLQLVI
jgi:hypothetical protein